MSLSESDANLPPGTNFCKCGSCGAYFNSELPFSMHRVGVGGERRCTAAGEMRDRGMSTNSKGYWISKQFKKRSQELADVTVMES